MNASLFSFNHVNFYFLPFYLNLERNLIKTCATFYWNPLNHRWCSLIFRYFCWRQFGIIIMCVVLLSKVTHMTTGVILHLNLICLELPFPSWHYYELYTYDGFRSCAVLLSSELLFREKQCDVWTSLLILCSGVFCFRLCSQNCYIREDSRFPG